jgi:predicted RNA-binding protein with PUA-like domain
VPQRFWLMKSEPNVFSIEDLAKAPNKTTHWDGVRNYQARNFLKQGMQVGDGVLFYHSRVEPMAVVGTAKVVRAGYPDPSQFDAKHKYYDPDSKPDKPRWYVVDIQLERIFERPVTLQTLRTLPELEGMMLLKKGSRLSVQPVEPAHWRVITKLGS